jgi:tol-pal system protein YbgF
MKLYHIFVTTALSMSIFFFYHSAFSNTPYVPVVDADASNNDQTIDIQENQIIHHTTPLLPIQSTGVSEHTLLKKINELQESIQALQTALRIQQHNIELLNIQQRSFYEDLNHRIQIQTNAENPAIQSPSKQTNNSENSGWLNHHGTKLYQRGFQKIMTKQYSDAETIFKKYLTQYPNGSEADSAHYWLGEIYLLQDHLTQAIDAFKAVTQYTSSSKIPNAKFKLALIHLQKGKIKQAVSEMKNIKTTYPNSTAAQLAAIRLQQAKSPSTL